MEYSEMTILNEIVRGLLKGAVLLSQKLIVAAIVFAVGTWVIKWIRKGVDIFLTRRKIDNTVKSFLDSVANISLKLVLFLAIVQIIGISTTSFTAILAAAGLAVGMAMKDNLSNFAGGVMLLVNKPFKIGDRILAQATDGEVQSIGILYTTMLTADNRTVYIPNGPLSTGTISNYSRQKTRRIDRTLIFKHGIKVEDAKQLIHNLLKEEKRILHHPAPFVGVTNITLVSVDISVRIWVNCADFDAVETFVNESIYSKLSEQGMY